MRATSRAATVVFRLVRPGLDALARDQVHRVAVAPHNAGRRRDIVGDDPVAALALALGAGICDHMLGLRGKADDEARPLRFALGDGRENVGVFDERKLRRAAASS